MARHGSDTWAYRRVSELLKLFLELPLTTGEPRSAWPWVDTVTRDDWLGDTRSTTSA
jgi:hypothetical protein